MPSVLPGSVLPAIVERPVPARSRVLSLTSRGRHARPVNHARLAAIGVSAALLPVPLAVAAPAEAATKQATTVRISAPVSVPYGTRALIGGRLVTRTGYPIRNALLEVQMPRAGGWRTVATMRTSPAGLAKRAIRLTATTRVRVYFRGSAAAHFKLSQQRVVTVRRSRTVASSSAFGARIIAEAARHRGKPYRWGGNGPNSFDCSGFTKYVFARNGKTLPRVSRDQQRATARVSTNAKRVGDLVFTWTGGRVTHVGIYAGGNRMWAAPRTGDVVKLQSIYSRNITVGRVR